MNKTELVAAIAERTELTKKDADQALKAFIDVVGDELSKGEKIQLAGFGTFEVTERAARDGINPRTKETIHIPASKAPKFKAMKSLILLIRSCLKVSVREDIMRLDKFLKVSRLIKRRTVANEACDAGRVLVNGKTAKASLNVKNGDVLEIQFGNKTVKAEILDVKDTAKKDEAKELFRYL